MRVAYVLGHEFSHESAVGLRAWGIASALIGSGHRVEIVSVGGASASSQPRPVETAIHLREVEPLGTGLGDTVRRYTVGQPALGSALRDGGYDAVIHMGTRTGLVRQVRAAGVPRELQIPDVVEWFQLRHMKAHAAIEHEASMRLLARRTHNMIAISRYLEDYYSARGVRVLRVPPLFDPPDTAVPVRSSGTDGPMNVVVAGTMGGKEANSIGNLITAAAVLNRRTLTVRVHLVGPTRDDILRLRGMKVGHLDSVSFHGRLPRSETLALVAAADFTALQRPASKRFARAGFPSKTVEGWMLGTPVITNLTSDLADYCDEGVNAVVLAGDNPAALVDGLSRAVLSRNAFDTQEIRRWAARQFSPHTFAEPLDRLLRAGSRSVYSASLRGPSPGSQW